MKIEKSTIKYYLSSFLWEVVRAFIYILIMFVYVKYFVLK
jgi:hypothetical protein